MEYPISLKLGTKGLQLERESFSVNLTDINLKGLSLEHYCTWLICYGAGLRIFVPGSILGNKPAGVPDATGCENTYHLLFRRNTFKK
jgi:hypothetical protein